MIRPGTALDINATVDLLAEFYAASHYARTGAAAIDRAYAKELLLTSLFYQGKATEGATWFEVSERDGKIVGLMLARLTRVYVIGDRLMASDVLFVVNRQAGLADAPTLALNMLGWARSVPLCVEARCGTTAVIGDPERAGQMYSRLGMQRYGSLWRMEFEREPLCLAS